MNLNFKVNFFCWFVFDSIPEQNVCTSFLSIKILQNSIPMIVRETSILQYIKKRWHIFTMCARIQNMSVVLMPSTLNWWKDTVEKIFWNLNFTWSFVYCLGYASHYNIFLFIFFFFFILVICVCLFSLSWLHILQNMLLYYYLRNRILIKMTLKRRQNERKGELYEIYRLRTAFYALSCIFNFNHLLLHNLLHSIRQHI